MWGCGDIQKKKGVKSTLDSCYLRWVRLVRPSVGNDALKYLNNFTDCGHGAPCKWGVVHWKNFV